MFNGYLASADGRIFSVAKNTFLKSTTTNGWYVHVHIMKNGKPMNAKVHRLIAMAFLGVPEYKMDVNHKNGIKTDNRVENLEWVSRSENVKHAIDFLGKKIVRGIDHPKSKTVINLKTGLFYDSVGEAAIAHGINRSTMKSYCRSGKHGFLYC